jgi:hypothetical protein
VSPTQISSVSLADALGDDLADSVECFAVGYVTLIGFKPPTG